MKSFILFTLLFGSLSVYAQLGTFGSGQNNQSNSTAGSSGVAVDEKEKIIRQKMKLKTYPGGFEEEPLKVQTQLNTVTRKMAPAQEVAEDAPAAGDNAHD